MKKYTSRTIEYYDSHLDNYIKSGGAEVVADKINKFIEILPEKKVLDIACGPGHDTNYMEQNGIQCTGVDLSREMIGHAKKNFQGEFLLMDFFNLKFVDNYFGGMWCSSIFVHVQKKDVPSLLNNFRAKLRSNGVIGIITVQKQKIQYVEGDTRQYTMYDKKELEDYLLRAGLKISHSESFNYGHKKRLFVLAKKISGKKV